METRVDVTTPRAHHQALQGSKTHGGIDASAAPDCRRAASVPKMRRNKLSLVSRFTDQFGGLQSHEMVACAVESVLADPIFLVVLVGNRVVKGVCRESLVESGIEHHDLGFTREQFSRNADTLNTWRI